MCNQEAYIKQRIKTQLQLAEKVEKVITPFLTNLAEKYNGKLHGLNYKFKSEESALRKILSHIDDDTSTNKNNSAYLDKKVEELKDYLRYTIVLDENGFTDNVSNILRELKDNDYKLMDLKNRFNEPYYKDISSHYFDNKTIKIQFIFELQFHTEKSLKAKEISHSLYEITREFEADLTQISEKIMEKIYETIRTLYNEVPIPEDVDKIKEKND